MPSPNRHAKRSPRRSEDVGPLERPSPQSFYRSIASVYVAGFSLLFAIWAWKRYSASSVASLAVHISCCRVVLCRTWRSQTSL